MLLLYLKRCEDIYDLSFSFTYLQHRLNSLCTNEQLQEFIFTVHNSNSIDHHLIYTPKGKKSLENKKA